MLRDIYSQENFKLIKYHLIFTLYLRKEKWLFIGIYKPSSQNSQYFLNILADLLDFYSFQYDDKAVLGDVNWLGFNNLIMLDLLKDYDFTNLIKGDTCFKGDGCCIDSPSRHLPA